MSFFKRTPVRTREHQSIILSGRRIEFVLVTSRLARNVSLKINHQNKLEVVVPLRFNSNHVPGLMRQKQDWIITKLAAAEKIRTVSRLQSGSIIKVLGIPKKIITTNFSPKTRIKETADGLILTSNWGALHLPHNISGDENTFDSAPLTSAEKDLLEKHLRKTSKTWLVKRTAEISEQMGTKYYRITIRAQRSRWGSCSHENNLNFNWKLVFMPLEVIDYIIIHELAHTVHHNHGPHFHALVENYCPNYRDLKKVLKNTATPF